MAAAVNPTVNDQITKVQLRLLKQRLEQERERATSVLNRGRHSQLIDGQYGHLKDAVTQRQGLLDRLKHEHQLSRQLYNRPASNGADDDDDDVAPKHRSRRRSESQPQYSENRRPLQNHKHPSKFQTTENASFWVQPPQPPPLLLHPPPPHPLQPASYAIPAAPSFQVVQPYQQMFSNPIISQQQPPTVNNNSRTEMYDMMMMQNAQMHQMIMQQLMLSSIPQRNIQRYDNNDNTQRSNSNNRDSKVFALDMEDIRKLLKTPPSPRERDRERYPPYVPSGYPYNTQFPFTLPPIVPAYQRGTEGQTVGLHGLIPALVAPLVTEPNTFRPDEYRSSHLQNHYARQENEQYRNNVAA